MTNDARNIDIQKTLLCIAVGKLWKESWAPIFEYGGGHGVLWKEAEINRVRLPHCAGVLKLMNMACQENINLLLLCRVQPLYVTSSAAQG